MPGGWIYPLEVIFKESFIAGSGFFDHWHQRHPSPFRPGAVLVLPQRFHLFSTLQPLHALPKAAPLQCSPDPSLLWAPQEAEGLHSHPGASGRDHRGFLEDALGKQLHHRRDADEASRDGAGEWGWDGLGGESCRTGTDRVTRTNGDPFARQEKCHQYWPAERSARYQYFVVDPMAEYNMPQYILREFKVTDARVGAGLGRAGAGVMG